MADHEFGTLLRELHEAELHNVIDEQVDVARDTLLIRQLFHCLLHQYGLRVDKLANVLNHLRVELGAHRGRNLLVRRLRHISIDCLYIVDCVLEA